MELKLQNGMNSDTMQEKKNKVMKRKRDESETSEDVKKTKDESKASESVKKKSNKKQKRKNDDKKFEAEDGAVKEGVSHTEHGSTVEQLVANAEVSIGFERYVIPDFARGLCSSLDILKYFIDQSDNLCERLNSNCLIFSSEGCI